jgi:hypothetical protein
MKYYYLDKVTCTIAAERTWDFEVEARVYESYMGALDFLFPNRPLEDYNIDDLDDANIYITPIYNIEKKKLMWLVTDMMSHTNEDLYEAITRINGLGRSPKYKLWLESDKKQYEVWYQELNESEKFDIYCRGEYSPMRLD